MALDLAQKLAPDWGRYFLLLDDCNLHALVHNKVQPSKGRTRYSWIWTTPRPPPFLLATTNCGAPQPTVPAPLLLSSALVSLAIDNMDSNVVNQDFERIQWVKCQVRAEQYEEEVQLTVEEMGQTLRYFEWKHDWWLSLTPNHTKSNSPPNIYSGLHAYAHQQSQLYDNLVM